MSFVDECKIFFKAGDGGDGIVAWRREAHVPLGGPAGGNGGNGGNVILIGDHNENSLHNLRYLKKIIAENGEKGQIKTMHGANGKDVKVKVPIGTMVYDENKKLIVDINEDGKEYIICHGGLGGFGNFHFKSGFNKAPTLYERGDIGEARNCTLVLKHLADVGIIGLPNAGKSTFISKISNAKPKTANYQFTTLNPILGTIDYKDQKIIFADIPGLIEGASDGLGLGHDFLKHIERTKVLIHIVSMNSDDYEDPINSFQIIMDELKKYSKELLDKEMIIVANKMDTDSAQQNFLKFQKFLKNKKIYQASTLNNENLNVIVDEACKLAMKHKTSNAVSNQPYRVELKKDFDSNLDRTLEIERIDEHTWEVKCEYLKYWSHRIPLNTQDNIVRFNQKMQTVMVEPQLKELGAIKGDTIKIYDVEMEFEE